jgi:hypothetical protein
MPAPAPRPKTFKAFLCIFVSNVFVDSLASFACGQVFPIGKIVNVLPSTFQIIPSVPICSQTIYKQFPKLPEPLFNRFRLKRMALSRGIPKPTCDMFFARFASGRNGSLLPTPRSGPRAMVVPNVATNAVPDSGLTANYPILIPS